MQEVDELDDNFQFHKGTIKAFDGEVTGKPTKSFNSIKVQLRRCCRALVIERHRPFNSIKVQLRLIQI